MINDIGSFNNPKVKILTYSDGKLFEVNHVYESVSFILCTCTVPSSPPEKITVIGVNSRTLTVSFSPPLIIDHNGKLTSYVIQYNRVGSGDIKNVSTTKTTVLLSPLDNFVNYSVTVAAVNGNGTGPFSNPVVQATGIISCQPVTLLNCICTVHLCIQSRLPPCTLHHIQ